MTRTQNTCPPIELYAGKTVFVVGLGRSGMAAAHALRAGGATVLCWDDGASACDAAREDGFIIQNPAAQIPNAQSAIHEAACLVLAPGIPLTHPKPHPAAIAARQAGVEIIGDIELLYRSRSAATFVGITGTNGKSTTTALIGHILKQADLDVAVGGNLGTPALSLPLADIYVLEMSSYQLDLTPSAVFDVSVLLNITPDHLDRHGGMAGYVAAKKSILRQKSAQALAVVGSDTAETRALADGHRATGGAVVEIAPTSEPAASLVKSGACPALAGDHGIQNAAAAYTVARHLGVDEANIERALKNFPGLAHRQERVATLDGVTYINDSKATNAEAAARALSAFDRIYWIAGGRDKNDGYAPLDPYIERVRHAFLIGEATEAIELWLDGRIPTTRSGDMASAVSDAYRAAQNDDDAGPVLLSPACASFDQFPNFEKRGDAFRDLVLALPARDRIIHNTEEAA